MKTNYSIIKPPKFALPDWSLLLIVAAMILCSGCNTTTFKATKPDGTTVEIHNSRVWWSTEQYAANLTTNGASLTASKSTVDSAAISAAVTGAVDATVKALGK